MLADRLEEWALDYKAKGVLQGMQQGMQKGKREGKREGKQEGKQEGEALALQRLLTKRFGPIPLDVTARIADASLEQIEAWFDLAIDAEKITDVFDTTSH